QTAFARLAKKCRSVAVSQTENLCPAMDTCVSVLVDSAQMGHHDPSELTMPHWCADLVDDLDEDVSVRDVEIAWVNSAGSCKRTELGRTIKVGDRGDTVRSCLVGDLRPKGPA